MNADTAQRLFFKQHYTMTPLVLDECLATFDAKEQAGMRERNPQITSLAHCVMINMLYRLSLAAATANGYREYADEQGNTIVFCYHPVVAIATAQGLQAGIALAKKYGFTLPKQPEGMWEVLDARHIMNADENKDAQLLLVGDDRGNLGTYYIAVAWAPRSLMAMPEMETYGNICPFAC